MGFVPWFCSICHKEKVPWPCWDLPPSFFQSSFDPSRVGLLLGVFPGWLYTPLLYVGLPRRALSLLTWVPTSSWLLAYSSGLFTCPLRSPWAESKPQPLMETPRGLSALPVADAVIWVHAAT